MIVTQAKADAAWIKLRQFARLTDEKWDAEELINVQGRTATEVNDAYRASCKHAHPDMGGRMEDFIEIDRAKHMLLHWLERKPEVVTAGAGRTCPDCNGKGYVAVQRALRAMRMTCPMCRGTGDLDSEHEKPGF